MDSSDRLLILFLLLALLYALYRYQQSMVDKEEENNNNNNNNNMAKSKIENDTGKNDINDVRIDNVSQLDLGSYEDVRSLPNDSLLGSFSDDISALLDENY